ncbi:MAG: hypothetical protein Q4G46_16760, partial [Propionibacteriaceae bacterium]|nr:hypothetical protein [Propionibacteriaceae bacterium]
APVDGETQSGDTTTTTSGDTSTLVPSTSDGFTGEVDTETIMVGPQEVRVPKGIKLPESALVTDAQEYHVMIGDEDPTLVTESITSSAEAAGYKLFANPVEGVYIYTGHGNAVLFEAGPQFQILTWGPESMAEELAKGPNG